MLQKNIREIESVKPLYIRLYEHLREYIESEDARRSGKLPTELELCRIFGVSRNTVSQALFMLEEERLICRIKHRGTFLASALNEFDPQNLRRTIGVVFPEPDLWNDTLTAIKSGCRRLGYDFRLFTYPWNDPVKERKATLKAEKCCSGVILYFSGNPKNIEYIKEKACHFPLVLFDLYIIGLKCNLVTTDHSLGASLLVQNLIGKGCRKFCILDNGVKNSSIRLRINGFQQTLEDHKISYELINCINGLPLESLNQKKFDAILDPGYTKLHQKLSVPGVWLGRFDHADRTEQKLFRTVIAQQNRTALGTNSVLLMKDLMRIGPTPERSVLVAPEIIEPKGEKG